MITVPRRALRGPLLILLAFSSIILLSRNIRDRFSTSPPAQPTENLSVWQAYYQPIQPGEYIAKTVDRRVTVTRTHTAWARVTTVSTIYLGGPSPAEQTPAPERHHADQQQPISTARPPLTNHTYRDDGLLQVDPDGPHPIYELIRHAEVKWQDKLDRASKTLDDAVREYHRRYKRPPPLGFDYWWDYAQEHSVQLPDEYDQIYNEFEHFWGMDPVDLRAIEQEWESHGDSFTIGKDNPGDPISVLNYTLVGGAHLLAPSGDFVRLLQDVEDYIPPFRAVFSPHDNPNLHTDWELKQMALQASREGKYIDTKDPPPIKLDGWISACAPDSPARNASIYIPFDLSLPPPPSPHKTFIHDHRKAMDPCLHPSHLLLHGQFLSHHKGPVPHRFMIPQFSLCPTLLHHDLTPPNTINWAEDIEPRSDDPEWEDKDDERLQWRGSNTGIWHSNDNRWWDSQRGRLVRMAEAFEPEITDRAAAFRHTNPTARTTASGANLLTSAPSGASDPAHNYVYYLPPWKSENEPVGEAVVAKRAVVNPGLMDVAFAREPLSCRDEVCDELLRMFEFRKPHGNREAGRYKYIVDVDGNGWSSRFKRLITSNSLIFKSTIYPEWFTDRVMPWVHFVPIQNDLSDLYDALVFFRGDTMTWHQDGTGSANDTRGERERVGRHDKMAKNIAMQGRKWSKTFWRREDMTAYIFRQMLEYARVMSLDRESMAYHHVFTKEGGRGPK